MNEINKKLRAGIVACVAFLTIFAWVYPSQTAFVLHISHNSNTQLTIKMPLRDKKRLEYFFRELFFCEFGIYTLLGSKPISFGVYWKPLEATSTMEFLQSVLPPNLKMKQGWKTWQKYSHLFDQNKFVIWGEPSPLISCATIVIIADREKMNAIVAEHQEDFTQALQVDSVTGDELLLLAQKAPLFRDILHRDERLMGILLGYGKGNAEFYCQRRDRMLLESKRALPKSDPLEDYFWEKETLLSSIRYQSKLHHKNTEIAQMVFYPSFVGNPQTDESQQLKKKFIEERGKIITYFEGKEFLEAVFNLLASADTPSEGGCPKVS